MIRARARAAARRRLHRRQPRLGLLRARTPAARRGPDERRPRGARARDQGTRARGRADRRRSGDLRAPRRRVPAASIASARSPLRGGRFPRPARGRAAASAREGRAAAEGAGLAVSRALARSPGPRCSGTGARVRLRDRARARADAAPGGRPAPRGAASQSVTRDAATRRALRGVARLAIDGPAGAGRAKQILVLERPARLRVEVLGLLDQTLAVLVTDGARYQLVRSRGPLDRRRAPSTTRCSARWPGIALTPEQAVGVLLGAPLRARARVSSAPRSCRTAGMRLEVRRDGALEREQLDCDAAGNVQRWALLGAGGELLLEARYGDRRTLGGVAFAHEVELRDLRTDASVRIAWSRVELDPVLPPESVRRARGGGALRCALRAAALAACVVASAGLHQRPVPVRRCGARAFSTCRIPKRRRRSTRRSPTRSTTTKCIANVYDTLLEYHYLKRPYELIPGLAEAVPEPRAARGRARRLPLHAAARRALPRATRASRSASAGRTQRELVAADVAFALQRIADPAVGSPVLEHLRRRSSGFAEFGKRLAKLREDDPAFAALPHRRAVPARRRASRAWSRTATHELEIVLDAPYPQILYWFAMPFTTPVPWEAVAYYDGEDGRDALRRSRRSAPAPSASRSTTSSSRIVLERNPNWYGAAHPEWRAPARDLSRREGEPERRARRAPRSGLRRPRAALPRSHRVPRREGERSPPSTSSCRATTTRSRHHQGELRHGGRTSGALSPEMAALGMRLEKTVEPGDLLHRLQHGRSGRGRAGRRARPQAAPGDEPRDRRARSSCALFLNGRGVPAQSPLPPGIFGYDAELPEPVPPASISSARAQLLAEAGYANGIDPATRPAAAAHLRHRRHLARRRGCATSSSSTPGGSSGSTSRSPPPTTTSSRTRCAAAPTRSSSGAGWPTIPDPENFLFLLWSADGAARRAAGPNTANFCDPRYDALFRAMKDRANDARARWR